MNKSDEHLARNTTEARLQRCERWMPIAVVSWVITIALAATMLSKEHRSGQSAFGTIRTRSLIILDAAGKERIVLAAPLPDPIVDGERKKRRVGVSAAIQIKDADGTERGGIASEDDGSFMFGIDDEHGHERAHLFYLPKEGSGVYLQSPKGGETFSLLNPSDANDKPKVKILTQAGTTIAEWPVRK